MSLTVFFARVHKRKTHAKGTYLEYEAFRLSPRISYILRTSHLRLASLLKMKEPMTSYPRTSCSGMGDLAVAHSLASSMSQNITIKDIIKPL